MRASVGFHKMLAQSVRLIIFALCQPQLRARWHSPNVSLMCASDYDHKCQLQLRGRWRSQNASLISPRVGIHKMSSPYLRVLAFTKCLPHLSVCWHLQKSASSVRVSAFTKCQSYLCIRWHS